MNAHRPSSYPLLALVAILLLSACQPAGRTSDLQPTQPTAQPTSGAPAGITLEYSAVAQNLTIETVAAAPANPDAPYWEGTPKYRCLTLQGYPVVNHQFEPQIFVYPVADLAKANETAGKGAADLQTLLQTRQAGDQLPFLPLSNAAQVLHAQVQYLDFKDGKGVRLLTQLAQGMVAVNNHELIYTFQGLTNDGKYYIAAVLPVTNPVLPASSKLSDEQAKALNDYPAYRSGMITLLNQQPSGSFTPDLNKLDAVIRSIEVK
jgi:hypothetical protein